MKATEEMSELRAAIELAGASPALTHCTILATELAARVEWLERYHEETLADHASGAPLHMIGDLAVKRATLALAVPEYPQPRSFGRSNARNLPRDE